MNTTLWIAQGLLAAFFFNTGINEADYLKRKVS